MQNIKIGIIGIGAMGKGLLYQSHITSGIECAAVCDININRCTGALDMLHLPYKIVRNSGEMDEVIAGNMVAVCEDGHLISKCSSLDAVVEASNSIIPAVQYGIVALNNGKHLILMNSEIDLTFGPVLTKIAKENGVVCTSCDGDQYGVLKHLIDEIKMWGFDLVMAGNIKGFLDRYSDPTKIIPEADKRNLDYRMCASYTDGTKLNIEMAIIANACDLVTRKPGMSGPRMGDVKQVFNYFDFNLLWKDRRPFVDYILDADPGGGVFVIGYCDNPYQKDMLKYYKMGEGPYYLFCRPYHLCHIESMDTIMKAVTEKRVLLSPDYGVRTNVYAYAKRDIQPGEILDGVGGYNCYGMIENLEDNITDPGIPICLADSVTLKRAFKKDDKILMSNIDCDMERMDFKLYKESLELSGIKAGTVYK